MLLLPPPIIPYNSFVITQIVLLLKTLIFIKTIGMRAIDIWQSPIRLAFPVLSTLYMHHKVVTTISVLVFPYHMNLQRSLGQKDF